MKKLYYYNSTLLLSVLILLSFNALAQPTDLCNSSFTGEGIPVSDQCNPRGFNVMNEYVANNSNGANDCGSSNRKDAYWWFQGTGGIVVIRYKPTGGNVTAGLYNPTMSVYTGSCSTNGGTPSTCVNEGSNGIMEVITMQTNFNTKYRIRIQNISSDNNYTMYGQICVMSLSTPNTNNKACDPYQLAVDSIPKPNYFQLSAFPTNNSINPAPTCAPDLSSKRKAFFMVTMPSTDLVIETEKKGTGTSTNNTANYINSAMAIYKVSGSGCNNGSETYTQLHCTLDGASYNMAKQHIKNGSGTGQATTGEKLLIVVWSENNNTSYFGISAYTSTQCGNPLGLKNDFCENPAQMYKAPGTLFSASTSGVFTPDQFPTGQTPNWSCEHGQQNIYIHNNSWYQFTATAKTDTFPFGASCQGIQAVILEATYNADSCCTGIFTNKSTCDSQMANDSDSAGLIIASNLTIGKKYILMVDGYAGAQCNFWIFNWNARNILLGINLSNFSAEANDGYNTLRWTTSSELNNDYFTIMKSTDGFTWQELEKIEGAGTSNKEIYYETYDQNIRMGNMYYQLKQTDFDGTETLSNIIVLNRGSKETGIINVSPNPTAGDVTININSTETEGSITITTINGQQVYYTTINNKGIHAVNFDMTDLPQGVYLVNYRDKSTQSIRQLVRQ